MLLYLIQAAHVRCQLERLNEERRKDPCKQIVCVQLLRGVTGALVQKTVIHSQPERVKDLRTEIHLN